MAISNILHLRYIKSCFIFEQFLSVKSLIMLPIEQTFESLLSEIPDLPVNFSCMCRCSVKIIVLNEIDVFCLYFVCSEQHKLLKKIQNL